MIIPYSYASPPDVAFRTSFLPSLRLWAAFHEAECAARRAFDGDDLHGRRLGDPVARGDHSHRPPAMALLVLRLASAAARCVWQSWAGFPRVAAAGIHFGSEALTTKEGDGLRGMRGGGRGARVHVGNNPPRIYALSPLAWRAICVIAEVLMNTKLAFIYLPSRSL